MYGMNPFEIEAEEDDDAKSEPNSMDLSEPLF